MNDFPGATEIDLAQKSSQKIAAVRFCNLLIDYLNHVRDLSSLCILLAFW